MCPSTAAHKPVHGQHGVEQNLCNQPACGAVDAHSRELAQSRVVEELVQTTAQPQNEGYYGENIYYNKGLVQKAPFLYNFFS